MSLPRWPPGTRAAPRTSSRSASSGRPAGPGSPRAPARRCGAARAPGGRACRTRRPGGCRRGRTAGRCAPAGHALRHGSARSTSFTSPDRIRSSPRRMTRQPESRASSCRCASLTPPAAGSRRPPRRAGARQSCYPPVDLCSFRQSGRMCSSRNSPTSTGEGAPSNRARAAVVFGNAITSRRLCAPTSSMTSRSKPNAKPPCGGTP
jgi:hypothetical protein